MVMFFFFAISRNIRRNEYNARLGTKKQGVIFREGEEVRKQIGTIRHHVSILEDRLPLLRLWRIIDFCLVINILTYRLLTQC